MSLDISITFLFGILLGSFNNVLIYRVPRNQSLLGRSKCTICNAQINWYNNIPLVSFVVQKRRCANCDASINISYPLIELLTAILVTTLSSSTENLPLKIALGLFASIGLSLAVIDWKYHRLPNILTYTLFALLNISLIIEFLDSKSNTGYIRALTCSLISIIFFILISIITKGGMGFGDVKFAASIGLLSGYFGYWVGYFAIMTSFALGALFGIWLMLTGKGDRKTKVAFGTFMYLGTYLILIFTSYL